MGSKLLPGVNDLLTVDPALAKQWHPTRNGDVRPSEIYSKSGTKVWWQCLKGHEWQATCSDRTLGKNCPYCSGRLAVPGETDLLSTHPELAAQWHPTKNGDLTPSMVKKGTGAPVWWICDIGHEWSAVIYPRTLGVGCPVCIGKQVLIGFNDMATTHPELAAQWHPTKNDKLTPHEVVAGTNKKVWWLCEAGHEWQSPASRRRNGAGCPVCAGQRVDVGVNDMATTHPELAAQWHPTKNGDLTPNSVGTFTSKAIWWICELEHEWLVSGNNRARGAGCPYCSGHKTWPGFNDMATTHPELAAEWHPTRNGPLSLSRVQAGQGKKIWWQCALGHEWESSGGDRVVGKGCPYCAGRYVLTGFNDMATTHPHLLAHWHPTKNVDATPQNVMAWTGKKLWWQCEKGHEWQATGASKASGVNCPTCWGRTVLRGFNDMATTAPHIAAQWHPTKNGELTPHDLTASSNRKVWWVCANGHSWPATASNRFMGRGCPTCSVGGFDPGKPSILYFITNKALRARKIGITNQGTNRLPDFGKVGWTAMYLLERSDGFLVQEVEAVLLNWIRKEWQMTPFLGPEEMGKLGGWTETFGEEGPSDLEVIERMKSEFSSRVQR